MADLVINKGANVPAARGQTWEQWHVHYCHGQNEVSKIPSTYCIRAIIWQRELSQGHLSGGNKMELTGSEAAIPVYEAEITAGVRLVVSQRGRFFDNINDAFPVSH